MKIPKRLAGNILNKILSKIGGGDISGIADGTITGAISEIIKQNEDLKSKLLDLENNQLKIKVKYYTVTGTKIENVAGHDFYIGKISIKNDIPSGTILSTIATGLFSVGYTGLPVESVGIWDNCVTVASEINGDRYVQVTWIYI